MKAFKVLAPNFSRVVIAESTRSCPVFEQDDITHDKGASFAFNAAGKLLMITQGQEFLFSSATVVPTLLPEWAKTKGGNEHE